MRNVAFFICFSVAMVLGSSAFAGDSSVTASNETIEGFNGSTDVAIGTDAAFDLSGFSYGLCSTMPGLTIPDGAIALGAGAQATNGGSGPDFFAPAQAPLLSPGGIADHTVGCVISFSGMDVLGAGANEVAITTYTDVANVEATYPLEFCDTLGTPLVITTVVDAGGAGFAPGFVNGSVTVTQGPPPYKFIAPTATVNFSGPGESTDVVLSIEETAGAGTQSQGFSFGIAIDAGLTVTAGAAAGPLAATNGGAGPDFIGENVAPANGPGYTAGVVVSFSGMDTLVVDGAPGSPVISLACDIDGMDGDNIDLTWSDMLGDPVVINTVVVNGVGQGVGFCDGRITLAVITAPVFRRGDCNDDGLVNIADGINIINEYVSGVGPVLGDCVEACDANDDGMGPDISDATYIFNYRFLGGAPPPAPFPDCGDGLEDDDCNAYGSCP